MKPKTRTIPKGFHAVTPSLMVKNSLEAIEFYKKAFGAKVLEVFPAPDGRGTMHATVQIGDSILMLGDERPGMGCKAGESPGVPPFCLYAYVPDADAAFNQAVAGGATVIMPLADMFWGDRCGTVKDPFGYAWTIATHTRDLTPEEVQEGAKTFFAKAAKP